jgi:D-alanyl-D-alanine carboxypeptidase
LPGISALVYTPNEGLWEGSAGYAEIENNISMTPCHVHYAASIPKSFTAVAILQQIELGKISLDSKIAGYLDENIKRYVPNVNKITIRQLLNQTSGLPDVIDIEFMTDFFNNPARYYSLEEMIAFLDGEKALWEPGTKHSYADTNYILLALILDNLTGDHVEYFHDHFFAPLGMTGTTYSYTINHSTVENLVSAYLDIYSDGSLGNITDWEDALTSYLKGPGGMATNSYDLSLFIRGVFDGTLVSDNTLNLIKSDTVHNPQADQWMNDSYGLGFMVIHDEYGTWYGHAGRDPGAAGYVFYNPEKDVIIASMTNIGTFFSMHYTEIFYGNLFSDLCDAALN